MPTYNSTTAISFHDLTSSRILPGGSSLYVSLYSIGNLEFHNPFGLEANIWNKNVDIVI
jgi:hypothetical protein